MVSLQWQGFVNFISDSGFSLQYHCSFYIFEDNCLFFTEQSQLGCRELRSTKYISDGQCTSLKAVNELVCAGECLPAHLLPNWIGGGYWARRDVSEWRCVNEHVRTQRVKLWCRDGSTRTYKIAAVTSCTCKRYTRQHNESELKPSSKKYTLKKSRGANTEA